MKEKILSEAIEEKKKLVEEISEKMKKSRTILIASTKGLPASQFQDIKKKLRGKAEVFVAKKSIVLRAIAKTERGAIQNLKNKIGADVALIISDIEAFELASLLIDNQSSAKAKVGDVSPEDIRIEPGPTDLMPGPAISELGSVGLKVAVEEGKLAIRQGATIVKQGEKINDKVAGVMGKLNILPMKVGFIPLSAYDSKSDSIFAEIKIDKKGTLNELKELIKKSLGFAINVGYNTKETITYFIVKAGMEEKALSRMIEEKFNKERQQSSEEKKDE
ncbi:50S ribosomal protein L10 [Candidatus Pacearchaeota archaeon]|nr:50S ribosomal protein L10 [Candidatus Pacearchaeota archaeon]